MPLTDKTLVHDDLGVETKVEPTVLFQITDHFQRRDEGQDFVVGTLLGTEDVAGVVQVCSCFPVPHTKVEDQIALNSEFFTTMLGLQQRVQPKHKVVGWYATGERISDATILFHEFFQGQDVERPVHLLLNLGLGKQQRMSSKAFISVDMTLGEARLGTSFREVPLSFVTDDSNRLGLETLLKMTDPSGSSAAEGAAELDSVEATVKSLLRTLEGVATHVEQVVQGKATAAPDVVQGLQALVTSAPRLPTEAFEKMFNTQVQDMLTISYLTNLTRTQLALAEKLQMAALNISAN